MATTQRKATGVGTGSEAEAKTSADPKPLKPKKCASPKCSKKFTPTKEWALYCSPTCSNRERGKRERARYREMREQLAKIDKGGGGKRK